MDAPAIESAEIVDGVRTGGFITAGRGDGADRFDPMDSSGANRAGGTVAGWAVGAIRSIEGVSAVCPPYARWARAVGTYVRRARPVMRLGFDSGVGGGEGMVDTAGISGGWGATGGTSVGAGNRGSRGVVVAWIVLGGAVGLGVVIGDRGTCVVAGNWALLGAVDGSAAGALDQIIGGGFGASTGVEAAA
jgi:hypothetical protein